MRAQLIPTNGGEPLELTRDLTVVGRKDEADLQIEHKSISKQHCIIVKSDGLLLVRDLGSTNGTRVNGQRVRRAALLPNDILGLASLKYRVQFGADLKPAVEPEAMTQRMDADEVQDLLKRTAQADDSDEHDVPAPDPVRLNALPDVYPDDDSLS